MSTAGEGGNSNQASATSTAPPIAGAEMRPPGIGMAGGNATLTVCASVLGHTYQLQYSGTMVPGDWHNTGSPVPGNGGAIGFITPIDRVSTPRRFFRVLIQQ